MSQLNAILERLATIQETVTTGSGAGQTVGQAYAYLPAAVPASECPFFVNEIAGGPADLSAASGMQAIVSRITMHLCIQPWGMDVSQEAALQAACAWRDAAFAAFAAKVRLGGDLAYILEAIVTAWDVEKLTLGTDFLALKFVLTVKELYTQTIAA